MAQVSRPVQILLLLTAVFGLAWFFVLRPKPVTAPPSAQTTAAPGQTGSGPTGGAAGTGNANTGVGKAVDKAVQGANTASQDANNAATANPGGATTSTPTGAPTTSPTGTTGPAPTTGGAAPPGQTVAPKGMPAPVAEALGKKKVVLLLFYSPTGADDMAVRKELKKVKRRNGKVFVSSAPITKLASYAGITRGVQVVQAPTIVVVDPDRKASTITGYTDSVVIDQAVTDALAASKKAATPQN